MPLSFNWNCRGVRTTHSTSQEHYVSLMFKAAASYASWDPLRRVRVGDYGRMQDDGTFVSVGNIFDEGLASQYAIEQRTEGQDGVRFVISGNSHKITIAPNVNVSLSGVAKGGIKQKASFSKGRGASLAMLAPRLTAITYPGRLAALLAAKPDWADVVVVSEVYTCRSYARLLTSSTSGEVTISLCADLPVPGLPGGTIGAGAGVHWQTDCYDGDWKTAHYEDCVPLETAGSDGAHDGHGPLCYPLFKLVALHPSPGSPVSRV